MCQISQDEVEICAAVLIKNYRSQLGRKSRRNDLWITQRTSDGGMPGCVCNTAQIYDTCLACCWILQLWFWRVRHDAVIKSSVSEDREEQIYKMCWTGTGLNRPVTQIQSATRFSSVFQKAQIYFFKLTRFNCLSNETVWLLGKCFLSCWELDEKTLVQNLHGCEV